VSWLTLSAKGYRKWQELIADHFYGDGYVIDIISHSAIRYREGGRSTTLSTEPLMRSTDSDRKEWILRVYVRHPLKWDGLDQPGISIAQERLILGRIEQGLKAKSKSYELVAEAI
jgi:hypothetical protein